MTEEEVKRDEEKRKTRLAEIAGMGDEYLKQLAEDTRQEFYMLAKEIARREQAKWALIMEVDGDASLRTLEAAIHAYGDHKGFDGTVRVRALPTGEYGIFVKEG